MERMLIATRKGLVIFKNQSHEWKYSEVHFKGIPVSYIYSDQYTGRWWACLDHGHWGCKLHYSDDFGKRWIEVEAPKYPEGTILKEDKLATTKYLWSMNSSQNNGVNKLYIGTEPGGLFVSEDQGKNFELVKSLWNHPSRKDQWFGGGRDQAGIHSILIDPKDDQHLFVGISVAGVFETMDGGQSWQPRNKGLKADFLPDQNAEVGQDPHLLDFCLKWPEVMWQQNHCGVFRTDNGGEKWEDISEDKGPANFGFAIQADEDDPNVAWVVPGISDEIRVAVDGALCVCRTDDGGKSWKAFREGLPQEGVFDITYRHALAKNKDQLVFGTTTGNLYLSNDRGESWKCLHNNLPMVYAIIFG